MSGPRHFHHAGLLTGDLRPTPHSELSPSDVEKLAETARCYRCKGEKPRDDFYRETKASGFKSICKACDRAKSAAYYGGQATVSVRPQAGGR